MLFSNDGGVHELLIMFTLLNVDGQLNVGVRCQRCLRALHLCRALDGPWMGLLSGLQDVSPVSFRCGDLKARLERGLGALRARRLPLSADPLFCAGVSDPILFFVQYVRPSRSFQPHLALL